MKCEELVARQICLVCKARPADEWAYTCEDDKCSRTFLELQVKGKLREFLESII